MFTDALDHRLREGLTELADTIDPAIAPLLTQATARGQRRLALRKTAAVAAICAVVGIPVAVAAVARSGGSPSPDPGESQSVSPSTSPTSTAQQSTSELLGTFVATVPNQGLVIQRERLWGTWRLTFHADGRLVVQAPETYLGVVAGASWSQAGSTIVITLFSADTCGNAPQGSYRFTRTAGGLRLTEAWDHWCTERVNLLTNRLWIPQA